MDKVQLAISAPEVYEPEAETPQAAPAGAVGSPDDAQKPNDARKPTGAAENAEPDPVPDEDEEYDDI